METRPDPRDRDDSSPPPGTLEDIQQARHRLAARVQAPWWYHLGAALCTAALFLGIGLYMRADLAGLAGGGAMATALTILGAIVGPPLLLAALKLRTGIAVDRYARGLGAWYVVVFGVLVIATTVQIATGLTQLLFLGAAVAFVATLLLERHIDRLLQRRLDPGSGRPSAA